MTATPGASDGAALSPTTSNTAPPATPAKAAQPATPAQAGSPVLPAKVGRPPTDVEALRAEIAHTRADLGETVQALAAKADVKARLQESADEARTRMREQLRVVAADVKAAATDPHKAQELALRARDAVRRNPRPYAVAAGIVLLVILVAGRRRRRNA